MFFAFSALQFPSIMTPVLDSVDAISCTCEKVLSEMTSEPITGEHYNILEVQNMNTYQYKRLAENSLGPFLI